MSSSHSPFLVLLLLFAFSCSISGQVPFTDEEWSTAIQKAKAFVTSLTPIEKANVVTGVGWSNGACVGNTPAIPRMNFSGLCLQDSPTGLRGADLSSAFPAAINAASTWNRTLIYEQAKAMGAEFRGKGVNIALGPMMNLLRAPLGGRNWEGYGGDPYLTGEAAYYAVLGIQSQGVMACAKHYIGNEQEHFRNSGSSNIDERTLHELYAWPFMRAVKAGVASIMCSYNLVNGTYACQNDHTLNDVLKGEFRFRGFIMSDWAATMSGMDSVNAGLDMTMPGDITFNSGTTYFGQNLVTGVNNGSIAAVRLDDMALRVMTTYYLLKQDQNYPAVNFNFFTPSKGKHVPVQADHANVIRKVGADSTVLLKNVNSALPLTNFVTKGTYTVNVTNTYNCTVQMQNATANGTIYYVNTTCTNYTLVTKNRVSYAIIGADAGPSVGGPNSCPAPNVANSADHGCNTGTLAQGWGSGTSLFPYLITPLDGITKRSALYNQTILASLSNTDLVTAKSIASHADVAIVCVNADSGEGYITVEGNAGDRNSMSLWHGGDALIQAVAGVNKNTIVVIHTVGPVTMPWINHPNVTAVVIAGLPGQESGNSLADVLFGDVNPSAKLVYTIGSSTADYAADLVTSGSQLPIVYKERLTIDYRWFDAKSITPIFPFGHGLSYTTFAYANLKITKVCPEGSVDDIRAKLLGNLPSFKNKNYQQEYKKLDMQETVLYEITLDVTNTGTIDGEEVVQFYLAHPDSAGEPPKILRGFEKVFIQSKATVQVTFRLTDLEMSIYDVATRSWTIPTGQFGVLIGASSRDIRLSDTFMR